MWVLHPYDDGAGTEPLLAERGAERRLSLANWRSCAMAVSMGHDGHPDFGVFAPADSNLEILLVRPPHGPYTLRGSGAIEGH
jgi:hypothetical protein